MLGTAPHFSHIPIFGPKPQSSAFNGSFALVVDFEVLHLNYTRCISVRILLNFVCWPSTSSLLDITYLTDFSITIML